ncbi:hypothetical protein [Methylobacterium dankookense]|uniref:Uncharacterized protein n=1 Tax=Methylobacterium dankookense TaxID=560405 RepID=A0A564FXJ3_9HYPH|nr:hypothetical protein [Methylobacterium dankookense]GJD54726.1 hypothetical protein IFDJLNFL_0605 [Methylobacterium dankookense]VUF12594.1 hypothetical protein MTDSW087_02287 [Methylobacterium dankookense]
MHGESESVATRMWRDRIQVREQERNEALARARIAEEKVALLEAENARLATEIARLRALLEPDAGRVRAETEAQMEALRLALLPMLAGSEA